MTLGILQMQRRLRGAGIDEAQANAFAESIAYILADHVATKADLEELRNEMNGKFAEMNGRLAEMNADMNSKFAEMNIEVNNKFAEANDKFAELATQIAELRNELANVKIAMADFKTGIAKWAVGIIGTILLGFAGMSAAIFLGLARLVG